MAWYYYIGAMLAGYVLSSLFLSLWLRCPLAHLLVYRNLMRPGKTGLDQDSLVSYAFHGFLAWVLFMYLRYFDPNSGSDIQLVVAFFCTVFVWTFVSYALGLYQLRKGFSKKDLEPTTRAWTDGPHLSPVQRAIREGLSHLAGFACAWGDATPLFVASFLAIFLIVTYGFYLVELEKEKEMMQIPSQSQASDDEKDKKS